MNQVANPPDQAPDPGGARRRGSSPKRRAKFAVGGAVVVLAVGALVVWALTRPGATSFFMTVSEVKAVKPGPAAASYRVNGDVVPGSLSRDGVETTFDITDGHQDLTVVTDDALPDAFWMAYDNDASTIEVVAQGHLEGSSFAASKVLAKCPSKFKAQT